MYLLVMDFITKEPITHYRVGEAMYDAFAHWVEPHAPRVLFDGPGEEASIIVPKFSRTSIQQTWGRGEFLTLSDGEKYQAFTPFCWRHTNPFTIGEVRFASGKAPHSSFTLRCAWVNWSDWAEIYDHLLDVFKPFIAFMDLSISPTVHDYVSMYPTKDPRLNDAPWCLSIDSTQVELGEICDCFITARNEKMVTLTLSPKLTDCIEKNHLIEIRRNEARRCLPKTVIY